MVPEPPNTNEASDFQGCTEAGGVRDDQSQVVIKKLSFIVRTPCMPLGTVPVAGRGWGGTEGGLSPERLGHTSQPTPLFPPWVSPPTTGTHSGEGATSLLPEWMVWRPSKHGHHSYRLFHRNFSNGGVGAIGTDHEIVDDMWLRRACRRGYGSECGKGSCHVDLFLPNYDSVFAQNWIHARKIFLIYLL